MGTPRLAFRYLSYLFLAGLAVQFFLAGYGLAQFGGHSIEAHQGLAGPLFLLALVMVAVALWGKLGTPVIGMTVVLVVLIALQYLWASDSLKPHWLRSFHVFDALLIAILGYHIAQRARILHQEIART